MMTNNRDYFLNKRGIQKPLGIYNEDNDVIMHSLQ